MTGFPVDPALARVHRYIDTRFDAHLERTRAFLRQPSISAENHGIHETALMVQARIEAAGGKAELIAGKRHPLVYGEIDRGKPKTLLIYGTGRSGGAPGEAAKLYALDKTTGKQVGAVEIASKTTAVLMTLGPALRGGEVR
jgi:hypothetical protein